MTDRGAIGTDDRVHHGKDEEKGRDHFCRHTTDSLFVQNGWSALRLSLKGPICASIFAPPLRQALFQRLARLRGFCYKQRQF